MGSLQFKSQHKITNTHKHWLSKRREKYVVLFQLISTSDKTNTNYRVSSLTTSSVWFQAAAMAVLGMPHFRCSQQPFCCLLWSKRLILRVRVQTFTWVAPVGFRQKLWMCAWRWASQQDCAVRWQMVTRAGKVTAMASSSIRGGCGGSPLRGGPLTEQAGSRRLLLLLV